MKPKARDLGHVLDGAEYMGWRPGARGRQAGCNGCTGVSGQRVTQTEAWEGRPQEVGPQAKKDRGAS